MGRYQKGKTNLDFTEARDSEWQWHQLGHTQVCTLLHTDNHASTSPLSFLQAGCPSCRPTNSVKALKAKKTTHKYKRKMTTGRKQQNTSTGCRFYIYAINRPTDLVIETEDFTQIVRPFHRRTGDVLVYQLDQCV